MTDDGAVVLPGPEGAAVPLRPRGAYVGYRAFASGGDAVLLAPGTARQLRAAAEFATRDGRVAGGLLYGTAGSDDEGDYLVVSGYLEAAPDEDPGRQPAAASPAEFVLSQADLRVLRDNAARMYPAVTEVGWWRSLGELGDFGPGDFLTQRELVGPDGVGLLVYGSGAHWGTAYLGPDGDAPDLAGTLVAADETAPDDIIGGHARAGAGAAGSAADQLAGPPTMPRPGAGPPTEPMPAADDTADLADLDDLTLADLDDLDLGNAGQAPVPDAPGTTVATRRQAALSPAPPPGPPAISPVRVPAREWGRNKEENPGYVGPETPLDVKLVVGGLIVAFLVIAVIIGMLVSNALIAVIVGVVFLLVVFGFVWMSRL
jgi:hypothetical protein